MKMFPPPATDLSRRRFVQGIVLGGVVTGLGLLRPSNVWALTSPGQPAVLSGTDFALDIAETPVNFTGAARWATAVNGGIPGPILRWKEGSTVTLRVRNRLRTPTSIHWHGIVLPFEMDGVPGISFPGIAPGETFVYRFQVRQSGTYWYHAHNRFQEQTGAYGPLVIEPAGPDRHPTDRDYVVMLNDWTDEDPERIFAKLKKHSDYYNVAQPTVPDFFRDVRKQGLSQALATRRMWNGMRMNPTDLSDVSGYTYTYLMNGTAPVGNWTGLFRPGEKIRLRFINGSSMTIFDVRIPGLKMTVIAADGQDVEPVAVDEFRIAVAETYDVIVEPQDERAYTLFAQSIDRSGYARGTLAPRHGMAADVPAMDPRVWLGMRDMMGAMDRPHGHGDMPGMSHDRMADMDSTPAMHHARTGYGPSVDMHVDTPRTSLDDPGIGLRDNGRRVLTYADLHTIGGPIDTREPSREIELHLTGNMDRYMWSFDGVKFSDARPIHFNSGERLRIVLVNDTMMNHPIHLHGMWSELDSPDGQFQVRKHTINVQPAQRVSYQVSADNPGRWAYHCHMLYHMETGMMRGGVMSANRDVTLSPMCRPILLAALLLVLPLATVAQDMPAKTSSTPPMDMDSMPGMTMESTHGDHSTSTARSPDYSDGIGYGSMTGMDMDDDAPRGMLLVDQLEAFAGRDANGQSWDIEGWYGNDENKLWLRSEGESAGGRLEEGDVEAFWNRNVTAFWSTQLGTRHDIGVGPQRDWAAFGVQGLVPYWVELEATGYAGPSGRTAARLRAEYELLFTQRLILQPEAEINLYGQSDPAQRVGSGLSDAQFGLRLRYEFNRQFAPYLGVNWVRRFGHTADYVRQDGQPVFDRQIVAGIRFWF